MSTPTLRIAARKVAALVVCLAGSQFAHGQVYECVDESGHITWTDRACPDKGVGDSVEVDDGNFVEGYPSAEEIKARQAQREAEKVRREAELASQHKQAAREAKREEDRLERESARRRNEAESEFDSSRSKKKWGYRYDGDEPSYKSSGEGSRGIDRGND